MFKPLNIDDDVPWKQRFRAEMILWAQVARLEPARGVVATNKHGDNQLYAWNVSTSTLTQLTFNPVGIFMGIISPNGRYVYYHEDKQGDEIGHWVRVLWEGGEPEDITPDMPPYSSFGLGFNLTGDLIGITIADKDGFHLYMITNVGNRFKQPKKLYYSQKMFFGPILSADGKIAVLTSTERATFQRQSLIALETTSGKQVAELWDGDNAGLMASRFAPSLGDTRILATTNRTGFPRPVIWNPVSGERSEIAMKNLAGDVSPVDWSPDGRYILLSRSHNAIRHLAVYDLATKELTQLKNPAGTFGVAFGMGIFFNSKNEIFTIWEDSTHPPELVSLNSRTGSKIRAILPAGKVPRGHPWKSIKFTSSDGP